MLFSWMVAFLETMLKGKCDLSTRKHPIMLIPLTSTGVFLNDVWFLCSQIVLSLFMEFNNNLFLL